MQAYSADDLFGTWHYEGVVAVFVMPFLNLALFFAVEMIIHLIFWGFGGAQDHQTDVKGDHSHE